MLTQQFKGKLQELIRLFKGRVDEDKTKILTQITYLLYLRFINNFGDNIINIAKIPGFDINSFYKKIRWDRFSKESPEVQYNLYLDYVLMFIRQNIFTFHNIKEYSHDFENLIKTPEMLAKAVELIDEAHALAKDCGWDNIKANGEVYEYLLNECLPSNRATYERTPRHIAKFMCALTKPSVHDRIVDPACGIGNILTSVVNHILLSGSTPEQISNDEDGMDTVNNIQIAIGNNNYLRSFTDGLLNGYDSNEENVFFCAMNMLFHGIDSPRTKKINVLSQTFDREENLGLYNVVLSNPPFGQYASKDNPSNLLLEYPLTKKQEVLYLHRTIDLMANGGRAAIILPEGVLSSNDKASVAARRRLVEDCRIDAVFSLPEGVFRPSSSVNTSIIVFTKTRRGWNDSIWFYELENDGYSQNNRRRKLTENPLPAAIAWFNNKENNDKAFSVEIPQIKENNYDLRCGKYKDYRDMEESWEDPRDIINDLMKEEKDLMQKLNELNTMI